MVAKVVSMDILLKQHSKLLWNIFHMNLRSSLKLEKNLRFDLLYLVAKEFLHLVNCHIKAKLVDLSWLCNP